MMQWSRRARAIGKDHEFTKINDEGTRRALFPLNFHPAA
jgi:GST-like protein